MSTVDPEILYLILSKTAAKESFYTFNAAQPGPGQLPGTITRRQLSAVYERITGNRNAGRLGWDAPLTQLNGLLKKCKLPPLGTVLLAEGDAPPDAAVLAQVHAAKWPTFSGLKTLLQKS
ncbi:hypothetical protein K2X30_13560 [bacterium]|nr:hypothetical protein [bacterium]